MSSTAIPFRKMHGLGNDFMLIDGTLQPVDAKTLSVQAWADRHTGVGFDQLLLLLPSRTADVYCQIFNADGSEAEQCGNGMRCVAHYLYESGRVANSRTLTIETRSGKIQAERQGAHQIEVEMGVPVLLPGWLELDVSFSAQPVRVFSLSLGNPHAILSVDALEGFPVGAAGKSIGTHDQFSSGTNAGFVEKLNSHEVRLKTWERGVGETQACGTNACAAAIAGIHQGSLVSPVTVHVPRGQLTVVWQGEGQPVRLQGEAREVFTGVCLMD